MKVELIPTPTEITDESIRQYLADCSSVVRNKQPKDNDRLFERLRKESYGDRASRVFEFVPCRISGDEFYDTFADVSQFFGFFNHAQQTYHTNARELLNVGVKWERVLELIDFTHYRAVKCTAPYFIYGQVSTHTQITSVSHSNRYTESDLGYWMPDEFTKWCKPAGITKEVGHWNWCVENYDKLELQAFMKDVLCINRREVYARGADMLQYRVFCLGGYLNNPNAWPHFINQRLRDLHTQKETRELAAMIEEAIQ